MNPKDIIGSRKVPIHYIPTEVLLEVGIAMMEGGLKYGAHNFRSVPVRASVYYDAGFRHGADWWEGEDIDPASGVNHIIKRIASDMVLASNILSGNMIDDRPVRLKGGLNMNHYNDLASKLVDDNPEPVEPFTEKKL